MASSLSGGKSASDGAAAPTTTYASLKGFSHVQLCFERWDPTARQKDCLHNRRTGALRWKWQFRGPRRSIVGTELVHEALLCMQASF